ncbi:hypothetical protein F902_02800 [Acinetobacter higginsii]|uniref:Uncharacterized protein n=2 Tax=Moraxellaceae TaxID=468 RepID=N9T4T3_9GAMM|nr:hypothetical protein F902_02800 [Acinetobacter higginsii]
MIHEAEENKMTTLTDLKNLITEAYQLFSSYLMGDQFEVCHGTCCLQTADGELLKRLPVALLNCRLIYEYLDAAESMDKFALAQQIKHLLPKILELLIQGENLSHSTEIILNKCYFNLENAWKTKEIQFMQKFTLAFFQYKAIYFDENYSLDEYITIFHLAGLDIQPLLDEWVLLLTHHSALINLANMLNYWFYNGIYNNSFADHKLKQIMYVWIKNSERQNIILDQFLYALEQNSLTPQQIETINSASHHLY